MSSTCGATCGITRERERQKESARALARRVSAPASWDDDAPFSRDEIERLASALCDVLPCQCVVIAGEGRGADWVQLVATVDTRSWLALRERGGVAPEAREETVLRVGLSPWARYATLQESRIRGERDGDGWWIEEERLAGVDDRRLAMFVKAAQGLLRSRKVVCLDAAFLCERVDERRTLWEALFDDEAMTGRSGVWVPDEAQMSSTREPSRRSETL